ncbi:unnamed protein product [Schistosoma turkestanicum]|nr:unnamed protein product [Schistosoma turkestanicum]
MVGVVIAAQTNTHNNSNHQSTKQEIDTVLNNSNPCLSMTNVSGQQHLTNDQESPLLIDDDNSNNNDNVLTKENHSECLIDRLFKQKQLILERLTEELHKYEQLCWDEMSITGIVCEQSNAFIDSFNIRCNSETRNPIITTPNRILNSLNDGVASSTPTTTTNRSRGIAARLKFRNSRRSKSAHDRIPESPQRSLHIRNKTDISPSRRNSITANLTDDNLESKKSWKWWRFHKDNELSHNNNNNNNNHIHRRQSIGFIPENQYLRGGSLPPTDNNSNNNNTKMEMKSPLESQNVHMRKSIQSDDCLNVFNVQQPQQPNIDECNPFINNHSHVNVLHHLPHHHQPLQQHQSFRQNQLKPAHHHHHHHYHPQQQHHLQSNGNIVHNESQNKTQLSKCVAANDLQRIHCHHQRVRHFSGNQVNEPLFYNHRSNQLELCEYTTPHIIDSSYCHIPSIQYTTIQQQSQPTTTTANKLSHNHHLFYLSPVLLSSSSTASSSSYTTGNKQHHQQQQTNRIQPTSNAYFYSLQRTNRSLSYTKQYSFEAPSSIAIVTTSIIPSKILTTNMISTLPPSTTTVPPIPPRVNGRRSIVLNNPHHQHPKCIEHTIIPSSHMNKTLLMTKHQLQCNDINNNGITISSSSSSSSTIVTSTNTTHTTNNTTNTTNMMNICKPTAETIMSLLSCNMNNNLQCFDRQNQHFYLNCLHDHQHEQLEQQQQQQQQNSRKVNILSNNAVHDKISSNHSSNNNNNNHVHRISDLKHPHQSLQFLPTKSIHHQPHATAHGVNFVVMCNDDRNSNQSANHQTNNQSNPTNRVNHNNNNNVNLLLFNNQAHIGLSMKNEHSLNTIIPSRLQSSHIMSNPHSQLVHRNHSFINHVNKSNEPVFFYQSNQTRSTINPSRIITNGFKTVQPIVSSTSSSSSSVVCNTTINRTTGWETKMNCINNNNNNNNNNKTLPTRYLIPIDSTKYWQPIIHGPPFNNQSHTVHYPQTIITPSSTSTSPSSSNYLNKTKLLTYHKTNQINQSGKTSDK